MVVSAGIDRKHYFGGGKQAAPTIVYQTYNTPAAPAPATSGSGSLMAATPAPPPRGDAARSVAARGLMSQGRKTGRMSTILAPRGTLEDQVKLLLGS